VAVSWEFLGFLEVPVVDIALFLELQAVVVVQSNSIWTDIWQF
jgi:hypothetical protein